MGKNELVLINGLAMKILEFLKRICSVSLSESEKKIDKEYFFGDYKIILKGNHVLDKYQKSFPLYDRFLPLLCADFEGLIIDIGANIGDTSIAIFSKNYKSFVVGVEPDDIFYTECLSNINQNDLNDRFLGVNKFVSTKKGNFSLEKNGSLSTGSMSCDVNEGVAINTVSFSELMDLVPEEKSVKFDILKIDTDGFDWDVINSFAEYADVLPTIPRFIFFEMQTYLNNIGVHDENREKISEKYKLSIQKLQSLGYNNFCLFDNFGTPIKITQSVNEIFELNDYIQRSQIYNSHSTIYYLDVLAFLDVNLEFVKETLSNLYKNYQL